MTSNDIASMYYAQHDMIQTDTLWYNCIVYKKKKKKSQYNKEPL